MGTVSRAAAPLSLQECKVRASLLLKELGSPEVSRATRAAERLRTLPPFASLSPGELIARRDSVQRKHALAVIAREQGFASWAELKAAREADAASGVDFEALLSRVGGLFLNRWFPTYEAALASLRADGGYLFPFRQQFFVCEASLLETLGVDVTDPDWARTGPDWMEPLDRAAHARLAERLARLAESLPSNRNRKVPMSSDNPSANPQSAGGKANRSELKRAYKEKPPPMGVFAVRNRANGKVLVGSSLNVEGSLNRIRFELTTGMPRIPALLEDWKRYGADNFSFEVLDVLPPAEEPGGDPKEELKVLEALWLDRLKPYGDAGYNEPPPPEPVKKS
ncbi:GIY-YIG nuclease family protein [Pyxidicoccus fallax]|uniref:GIY-YIG nuclease family protein n=1 Tax=Pyxidicoccus fallax TaxID=394095 RepID=A0A848LGI1_9BACT|nr:GIY-YIG nuclease family protein [Pyxidicoccus fallax]NMO16653.1 GIY-YIG nuclease family protein [Pyxidicoccus fallax]NPC80298.1 GIY-YIG nuclease family protein [Pyxidicoccus fallax]